MRAASTARQGADDNDTFGALSPRTVRPHPGGTRSGCGGGHGDDDARRARRRSPRARTRVAESPARSRREGRRPHPQRDPVLRHRGFRHGRRTRSATPSTTSSTGWKGPERPVAPIRDMRQGEGASSSHSCPSSPRGRVVGDGGLPARVRPAHPSEFHPDRYRAARSPNSGEQMGASPSRPDRTWRATRSDRTVLCGSVARCRRTDRSMWRHRAMVCTASAVTTRARTRKTAAEV